MSIIGIPIGFYGYLFPGNINLMVVELSCAKKYRLLSLMLLLIVVFESIYCGLSLLFLNVISGNSQLYKSIEIVSYVLIFIMGLWMIVEKRNDKKTAHQNTLIRGIINIIIHPQQIPFWVVAGVLINKVVQLNSNTCALPLFVFYNAVGTLLAMFTYIIIGKKIMNYFKLTISPINKVMGAAYIVLALYQLISL